MGGRQHGRDAAKGKSADTNPPRIDSRMRGEESVRAINVRQRLDHRARPTGRAAGEAARRPLVGFQRDEAGFVQNIGIAAFAQRWPRGAMQENDRRMLVAAVIGDAQPRGDGEWDVVRERNVV